MTDLDLTIQLDYGIDQLNRGVELERVAERVDPSLRACLFAFALLKRTVEEEPRPEFRDSLRARLTGERATGSTPIRMPGGLARVAAVAATALLVGSAVNPALAAGLVDHVRQAFGPPVAALLETAMSEVASVAGIADDGPGPIVGPQFLEPSNGPVPMAEGSAPKDEPLIRPAGGATSTERSPNAVAGTGSLEVAPGTTEQPVAPPTHVTSAPDGAAGQNARGAGAAQNDATRGRSLADPAAQGWQAGAAAKANPGAGRGTGSARLDKALTQHGPDGANPAAGGETGSAGPGKALTPHGPDGVTPHGLSDGTGKPADTPGSGSSVAAQGHGLDSVTPPGLSDGTGKPADTPGNGPSVTARGNGPDRS